MNFSLQKNASFLNIKMLRSAGILLCAFSFDKKKCAWYFNACKLSDFYRHTHAVCSQYKVQKSYLFCTKLNF